MEIVHDVIGMMHDLIDTIGILMVIVLQIAHLVQCSRLHAKLSAVGTVVTLAASTTKEIASEIVSGPKNPA